MIKKTRHIMWLLLWLLSFSCRAEAFFTIGQKNLNLKDSVHKIFFMTPHNEELRVRARIYGGHWDRGLCVQDTATSNIGYDHVQTGDFIDIDSNQLKAVIGAGYSCLGISFIHVQKTTQILRLDWQNDRYQSRRHGKSQIVVY